MDEESRNIGNNIPDSAKSAPDGDINGNADQEGMRRNSASADAQDAGGVSGEAVSGAAADTGGSAAGSESAGSGYHGYTNENTGKYSNGGGQWGTYEDWNFGILEEGRSGQDKSGVSGTSERQKSNSGNGNPVGDGQDGGYSQGSWKQGAWQGSTESGQKGYGGGADGNPSGGQRYSGPQYGYSGDSGYHSPYDAYRFESPDIDYGSSGGSGGGDRGTKNAGNGGGGKKTVIITALITAAVVLGIFFGIRAARRPLSGSGSSSSGSTDSGSEIVLGNPDGTDSSAAESVAELDPDSIASSAEEADADGELTTTQVVEKVMPSMVSITNTTMEQYWNIYGQLQSSESVSAGSGIIVGRTDENLLIATNNHVISDSDDITVTFNDDSPATGTVLGADADNDLAIVAVSLNDVSSDTLDSIAIVSIGDSDEVRVGQSVVAIGNALGYGQSVSKGIVSALNREVTDSDGTTRTLIQTDASINPGNSGGALLNMKGELIGINEAKYVDETVEGVGYAIPMDTAEPILKELGSRTARSKVSDDEASYLGVSVVTMPSAYTSQGYPSGAYVASVVTGGPADAAGIKAGDIITAFDGTSISTKEELIERLEYYAAGEQVEVSVSRLNDDSTSFEKERLTVTLGNKSEMSSAQDAQGSAESTAVRGDTGEDFSQGRFFGY